MASYPKKRLIPIILVIVIVIVVVAALVSITRSIFFSSNAPSATSNTNQNALTNTAAGSSVRMTVRGVIVANEDFRSYQITISPTSRVLTGYSGYLRTQTQQVMLSNNIPAYEEFVNALDQADLNKGSELTGDRNDVSGVCATGKLYQFEIANNGQPVKSLWTTTCRASKGSLDATLSPLLALFTKQIPDGASVIRKIDL